MKRSILAVLIGVVAALTVAINVRGHVSPDGETHLTTMNIAEAGNLGPCFPGTELGIPSGPYRTYLPLILCSCELAPPTPPICASEIESNDIHTGAQMVTNYCIEGNTLWSGDVDWYRLDICSPADLFLTLEGDVGTDLDLHLHEDPPGWPLYSSEEVGTSTEAITATGLVSGTYYILVQPIEGQGEYDLSMSARAVR